MPTTDANQVKPFTWIVRFDVAPLWVADGFNLDDACAMHMLLNTGLHSACCHTELAAKVISAPDANRIHAERGSRFKYKAGIDSDSIRKSILDAIDYLNSDTNSSAVVASLKQSLALLDGSEPISEIEWQNTEK
jgi:hypothetical protein